MVVSVNRISNSFLRGYIIQTTMYMKTNKYHIIYPFITKWKHQPNFLIALFFISFVGWLFQSTTATRAPGNYLYNCIDKSVLKGNLIKKLLKFPRLSLSLSLLLLNKQFILILSANSALLFMKTHMKYSVFYKSIIGIICW